MKTPKPSRVGAGSLSGRYIAIILLLGGLLYVYADSVGGRRMMLESPGTSIDAGHRMDQFGVSMTTTSGNLEIAEFCQQAHSKRLAQRFVNLTVEVPFWTACSANQWIDKYNELSPSGPKTFVDIGCNKGYTSAHFFGLWAPELGFRPNTLQTKRPEILCGTCKDCEEQVKPARNTSQGDIRVFCMEPSLHNFANLVLTRDAFFAQAPANVQWYVVNAAMSNDTGLVKFARDCVDELCSLDTKVSSYDFVHMLTVDYFMKKYEVPRIDILKIDTEGFDATVVMGTMEAIAKGRVGLVSFEYHEVGVWREYKLQDIVDMLDGMDYVCYMDGKPTMSRMTGCWNPLYEKYAWSNVVCVPRSHFMYPEMERMTTRFQEYPAEYFVEQSAAAKAKAAAAAAAT